jgi:hypothetical protein
MYICRLRLDQSSKLVGTKKSAMAGTIAGAILIPAGAAVIGFVLPFVRAGLSSDGNKLVCSLTNTSSKEINLRQFYLPHGKWCCEPPALRLNPGETTRWAAKKRAIFYGTTAVVIFSDGKADYMFGASHPYSGKSEVALGSTSRGDQVPHAQKLFK